MESKLELAEKYYRVARDVRDQAEYLTAMADTLDSYADRLCEQNMREAKVPDYIRNGPSTYGEPVAASGNTSCPQSEKP